MRHSLLRAAAGVAAVLAISGCSSGSDYHSALTGTVAGWELANADELNTESTSVAINVWRIECAGGETGTVLEPVVSYEDDRIVIVAQVEPNPTDAAYTCPSNNLVEVVVDLGEPIGNRALVNGQCLDGKTTSNESLICLPEIMWEP